MDEKAYILKEKSIKCILSYIAVALVIVPIIYMTITKSSDSVNTLLLQVIINFICYISLSVIFIIMLRKELFDDWANLTLDQKQAIRMMLKAMKHE